jgi:5-methyltetrahydrofolate--homocysteine methyltransferase
MGTMLQKYGLKAGQRPDIMSIEAPEAVETVHRLYVQAGSEIICSNTFGCNADALKDTGYTPEKLITCAVEIAKKAAGSLAKVALDIGPTGQLMEPMGDLEVQRAYDMFMEQAVAGEKAGADFAAIETMSDISEVKAAVSAVTENTKLPVLVTMSFDKTGRTFMGCTPEQFAKVALACGATAIGLNCSLEPQEMYETAKKLKEATTLPLIIKPNAGLPDKKSGNYDTGPEEFAKQMLPYAQLGAKIVGGCCGTTPEYIRGLKKAYEKF